MKLLSLLLTLILYFNILTPAFGQSPSPGPEKVDVYALFWPLVAGRTVKDPLFFAKQLKEGLMGMIAGGDVKKGFHYTEISEKRLVEAAMLFEEKDETNGLKSLEMNKAARDEALRLKKKAVEEKQEVLELTNRMVKSLENEQKALAFIETRVSEEAKGKVADMNKELTLQISEAK